MTDVYLLPGLDGTGTLFSPFINAAPEWANPIVVPYDNSVSRDYDELALGVSKLIDFDKSHILLGESFSGPVAILAATKSKQNLAGVVLCASFVKDPRPLISRFTPDFLLRFFVARFGRENGIRHFLALKDSPAELLKAAAAVIRSVPGKTLMSRLKLIQSVDVSQHLSDIDCPVLYLRATRDKVVPQAAADLIRRLKSDASLAEIDTSHFLLQTRPKEAWDAIGRFANHDR